MVIRLAMTLLTITTLLVAPAAFTQTPLQKVTINFPTRSGASWPLAIAKEGGYFQKYGLEVNLAFGAGNLGVAMITSGDAVMTNSSMEQALQASSRDPGALVSMGSSLNKGTFSLMAAKGIARVQDLKGKRIGVSQVGDAPYNYTIALLDKFGLTARDVQWLPVGQDATARASALSSNRVDATLLTAPAYFRMEEQGFKSLANLASYSDIYASTVYLFTKKGVAANPKLPEMIIRAQTEAIKRFYDDKAFAVKAYLAIDPQAKSEDIGRIYDLYAKNNAFERIPYVLASAVKSTVDQAAAETATTMRAIDFKSVVDNGVVDRLMKEGFFEKIFGAGIRTEQNNRSTLALR